MKKLTHDRKQEILRQVNKGLEWQFETYSWSHMINDALSGIGFTKEEIEWAKDHTGYKAYISE
jgi:hypothetical protein